jgi:succinate dehydrogenase / fumarate reductase, membrane anchor subunit
VRLFGGLRPWIWQRLSAIYMVFFLAVFATAIAVAGPMDFAAWRDWIGVPAVTIAVALFFASVFLHAWIGLRDIVLDYIHSPPLRALVLGIGVFGLLAMTLRIVIALAALHGASA